MILRIVNRRQLPKEYMDLIQNCVYARSKHYNICVFLSTLFCYSITNLVISKNGMIQKSHRFYEFYN